MTHSVAAKISNLQNQKNLLCLQCKLEERQIRGVEAKTKPEKKCYEILTYYLEQPASLLANFLSAKFTYSHWQK